MKTKMILPLVLSLISQMAHSHDELINNDLKQSVVNFFKRAAGDPKGCDFFREGFAKDPNNQQTKALMTGFCDSEIDFTKPVSFSEVSKHVSEGHPYVCGVISGETNPGRKIGVRFITAEPYHLVIGFKYSRRPIAYSGNDQFTIDEYHRQIETFNKLNSEICK
ncbi:hypothetical protein PO654_03960 [Phytobacter diazotrophicus]|uniref:Uncharacterized protein n=1 Tax=Phytobacter diazotrophicus TaxID=395631 RepID=A0ABM7VX29_9ENTR|nr:MULTISPECIES: hypothetical protein [Phytobacter]MDU4152926.1 hypothetical protein [Enterobacteriaceae bacterium]MDU4355216.1 hypothetical protein [Phytobacter diazotrophicus]MDU7130844.1 hypothetical protein [Enterobacteriaceae bacterium]MDU7381136.1 hypothetical protein [Enterobacteriaceae bacterium]BBE78433.1 hypothetical protein MRY16398_34890 [Phytobacter sp. MRY16-398]